MYWFMKNFTLSKHISNGVKNDKNFTIRTSCLQKYAIALVWYLENLFDILISRFTLLKSTQD